MMALLLVMRSSEITSRVGEPRSKFYNTCELSYFSPGQLRFLLGELES